MINRSSAAGPTCGMAATVRRWRLRIGAHLLNAMPTKNNLMALGWREWINIPEPRLPAIKAKADTGAGTSALHAFRVRPFPESGLRHVEFRTHPSQRGHDTVAACTADVMEERRVSDSGGHKDGRWVTETPLSVGSNTWPIEITLTARNDMLWCRTALKDRVRVKRARSYLADNKRRKKGNGI